MFNSYLNNNPDYANQPMITDPDLLKSRTEHLFQLSLEDTNDSEEYKETVKLIVLSLMRSVMGLVNNLKLYDDEFSGYALLTLQELVTNLPNVTKNPDFNPETFNTAYYVLSIIKKRLNDACRKRNPVSMSVSTMVNRDKKGLPRLIRRSPNDLVNKYNVFQQVDFLDELEKMVRTHRQKLVALMAIEGKTIREIAEELKIGSGTVSREIKELQVILEGRKYDD